jgi:phosphate starvation-inducible PhoH-like protein
LAEALKLTFDERLPLQLMLEAVERRNGGGVPLEKQTGVAIHVRGQEVSLCGERDQADLVARLLRQLYALARGGQPLSSAEIPRALSLLRQDPQADLRGVFEDVLFLRGDGRKVGPRTARQKGYVECMRSHALTFAVGPAGTGKSFLAVAMAVRMLVDEKVRRIVISRPAIEAGENLGYLPGTVQDKISPYLRPIYDALYDLLDADKVTRMQEQEKIEIAPLAYMRGRTLTDAFVILDEAQNATREQMKMFLTRIGHGTRAVVTGDPSQVDLPGPKPSGLPHALRVLQGVGGVAVCAFSDEDVMRHPLVQAIVQAYERDAQQRRQTAPAPEGTGTGAANGTGNGSGAAK